MTKVEKRFGADAETPLEHVAPLLGQIESLTGLTKDSFTGGKARGGAAEARDDALQRELGDLRAAVAMREEMINGARKAASRLMCENTELISVLESVDEMFSRPGVINKTTVRDLVRDTLKKAGCA